MFESVLRLYGTMWLVTSFCRRWWSSTASWTTSYSGPRQWCVCLSCLTNQVSFFMTFAYLFSSPKPHTSIHLVLNMKHGLARKWNWLDQLIFITRWIYVFNTHETQGKCTLSEVKGVRQYLYYTVMYTQRQIRTFHSPSISVGSSLLKRNIVDLCLSVSAQTDFRAGNSFLLMMMMRMRMMMFVAFLVTCLHKYRTTTPESPNCRLWWWGGCWGWRVISVWNGLWRSHCVWLSLSASPSQSVSVSDPGHQVPVYWFAEA